jgi:transcriptional regulator with AAA-type ATPase domain
MRNSQGLLAAGDKGTVYIDELEGASHEVQRLLLSFLDTQSLVPIGGTTSVRVDVRVIASTRVHPNELSSVVPDLFLRLSGFVLEIPPLRDRPQDIPILVDHFLNSSSRLFGREPTFSPEAIAKLKQYKFPGNVRELHNIVERAVVMSEGDNITASDLGLQQFKPEPEGEAAERLRRELAQTKRELDLVRRGTIPANPIWEGRWIPQVWVLNRNRDTYRGNVATGRFSGLIAVALPNSSTRERLPLAASFKSASWRSRMSWSTVPHGIANDMFRYRAAMGRSVWSS